MTTVADGKKSWLWWREEIPAEVTEISRSIAMLRQEAQDLAHHNRRLRALIKAIDPKTSVDHEMGKET